MKATFGVETSGLGSPYPLLALLYLITSKTIMEITQNGLRSDKYFETSQLLTHPKGNRKIVEQTRKGLRANL